MALRLVDDVEFMIDDDGRGEDSIVSFRAKLVIIGFGKRIGYRVRCLERLFV